MTAQTYHQQMAETGPGCPTVKFIEERIAFYKRELAKMEEELEQVRGDLMDEPRPSRRWRSREETKRSGPMEDRQTPTKVLTGSSSPGSTRFTAGRRPGWA